MQRSRPAFLITIDTEGDNIWSNPREVSTTNSRFLPAFQRLCEEHGFRPTYLVNYEMACCPVFQEFGRSVLREQTAEIGAHIHPWNSPPEFALTEDDGRRHPCMTEYPPDIVWSKVAAQTLLLEDIFERKMTSHRAGRWGFNGEYARALIGHGYLTDCSVTPGLAWPSALGKCAGPDYTEAPSGPYFVDLDDIRRPGRSPLLELPMTIMSVWSGVDPVRAKLKPGSPLRRALNRLLPQRTWLRPNGGNLFGIRRLLSQALVEQRPFVEFMLHSSELMPGGSPNFPSEDSIRRLYSDLRAILTAARKLFEPLSLTEYAQRYCAAQCVEGAGQGRAPGC